MQDSLFHSIENAEVLHHFQVLRFVQIQLVGVLAGLEWVDHCGRVSHAHLLGHLVGSYRLLVMVLMGEGQIDAYRYHCRG